MTMILAMLVIALCFCVYKAMTEKPQRVPHTAESRQALADAERRVVQAQRRLEQHEEEWGHLL